MRQTSVNSQLTLATYNAIDQLRIMATNAGVNTLFDIIITNPERIIYEDFSESESSLISTLVFSSGGINAAVNKKLATAGIMRDGNTLKFSNEVDGRVATLHAILRLLFNTIPPLDTILGQAHHLFTTLMYTLVLNNFNKDYSLIDIPEEQKASLRYACACITAAKHFELSCNINDVAIPMTTMILSSVRPASYVTNNNIVTWEGFALYLKERVNIDIDKSSFINKLLTTLSNRTLILMECGVDLMIDCLLSKINGTMLIPRKLGTSLIKPQMYSNIKNKIAQVYYQQLSLNIPR